MVRYDWASPVVQMVKNLSAMQETQVQSLGQEDLLEKEMATHSSTLLPGKFHGRRSLAGCNPWGCKELDRTEGLQCQCQIAGREHSSTHQ